MNSCWIRVSPKSNDWCPYKGNLDTKTQRRHTQRENMPGEDGVMQECQRLPEANKSYEEARKDFSIKSLEGGWPC